MPPVVTQNSSSSNRRSTGSMRQRENRALVPASTGSTRRRRSRSPDARAIDEAPPQLDIVLRRKKRSSHTNGGGTPSSNAANMALVRTSVHDDSGDRGRIKAKPRSKALMWVDDEDDDIVTNIVHDNGRSSNAQNARPKRKERSRSRDAPHRNSRKAAAPNESTEDEDDPMYTGPLAQAEYTRMKQEIETMRKQVAMAKKTIGRQSKVIDELRSELSTTDELHRSQRVEMEKLKRITKKSDDLIATMETNLTCQICMEILLKPYGLSPCGHVLCVTCLQGWFKNAPAGDDDMMDDDYPDALIYRKKTCPCCRAVVRSRPIPLYLVKSIASALDKSKAPAGAARPSPPPDDEDPWAGIFRDHTEVDDYWSSDHDEDEDEDEEDEEDEDGEDGEGYDDEDGYWSFDGYGTGEEDERYDGPYVTAQWAPPTVPVSQEEYPFLEEDADEFSMLRRGVTLQMIELFEMSYCHNTGLCAMVDGENAVHLGFNIELHPDDETGEEYIDWVLADIYGRPERWRVENDHREGTWSAWRLIPAEEDEEYDNTDSEVWADEMVDDDDM